MKTRLMMVGWMLAAPLVGCSAGAQVVRQDARGGQLVAWGPVVPAAQEAREHMVRHCQGRYAITEQTTSAKDDTRKVTYVCETSLAMLRGATLANAAQVRASAAP